MKTRTSHPGRPSATRSSSACGFSLIELLVVVSIIALMAGLATPALRTTFPRFEISGAAEAMGESLRRARAAAISGNREVLFELDVPTGTFGMSAGGKKGKVPDGAGIELVAARTEIVDGTRGRIRFYPDGTSTGGEIKIRRGLNVATVEVDWFNGRVILSDDDG